MEHNENFSFTYSARQQKEVEDIRRNYLPREEDKLEQLRRLHARPTQKAQAASIAVGTTGALTLGTGMSICLTEIGAALGSLSMVTGIAVGLAGLLLAALAYPLYNRVLKTQRAKIAPNILRISDELLQG